MKKLLIIVGFLILGYSPVIARHIKGGEINYTYLGTGSLPSSDRYEITLRLFLDCNASGQQLDPEVLIAIYNNSFEAPLAGSPFTFPLTTDLQISLTTPNPCITSPSPVCYRLRIYSRVLDIPRDPRGFTFVFQRCCRINGLVNISPNGNIGASYTNRMAEFDFLPNEFNSSPSFAIKDTVLICQNRPFTIDFSANDIDGDSLTYEFCEAFTSPQQGGGGAAVNPVPPSQIGTVTYASGFSGGRPLGSSVNIDSKTGLISGVAPGGGDYVISVCVKEWRRGRLLSEHRKDFNIQIDQRCDIAAALLNPTYANCESFSNTFQNESPPSALINTYHWDFGVPNLSSDTSNLSTPTYTYRDTGIYKIKLHINRGQQCPDSAETKLSIFPGFFPGFDAKGSCVQVPYSFSDTSKARYGFVNSWQWDLGDLSTEADLFDTKNTSWKYSNTGPKTVILKVGTSKGCEATVTKILVVNDKPIVNLAFKDTLICSIDTLQLIVNGQGIYSWGPNYNIIDPNVTSPFVFPKRTTVYKVDMNDNGCIGSDSVKVRVVDFVTLNAGPDSTICLTDSVRLRPTTDGLRYSWTPAGTLDNAFVKNPVAFPTAPTTVYALTASIGKCNTTDNLVIRTVPYPFSFAGADTLVCFDDTATLKARFTGSRIQWSPSAFLNNNRSPIVLAWPKETTTYTLAVYDTIGCPKPGLSSVVVNVKEQIFAFAGNDTAVVIGQPLQLNGRGADLYSWSPSFFINNPNAQNPIALLDDNYSYILKASTVDGCFALDTINIKVFKSAPDFFVPNAFAPTGRNRLLRPIAVGIASFDYFRVYNRWGQLVFQTNQAGKGWDGSISGTIQNTGTYVWQARGKDYTGKMIIRQGTAILIR